MRFIDYVDKVRSVILGCRNREQLEAASNYCRLLCTQLRRDRYPLVKELEEVVAELEREQNHDVKSGIFLR